MDCPACHGAMDEQTLEANYGRAVVVDICHACAALWFDTMESLQLTPRSVLRLFALVHDRRGEGAPTGPARCPRCSARLQDAADMQRGTRFHYRRCPAEHGRFITFFQFLREKDFVRPLNPAEITQLKARVGVVNCGSCGAAVDLDRAAVCGHCRAPIAILDAEQVEKAVRALERADERRSTIDPQWPARLMMDRLAVERAVGEPGGRVGRLRLGLLDAGLDAVLRALRGLD